MADKDKSTYQKAKDAVSEAGANFAAKAKETAASIAAAVTGNSGMLGGAKDALQSRKNKIDKAIEESDANGGVVGRKRRAQRG